MDIKDERTLMALLAVCVAAIVIVAMVAAFLASGSCEQICGMAGVQSASQNPNGSRICVCKELE